MHMSMNRPAFASHSPVPRWVPDAVRAYLAHLENGVSIRQIARDKGCHASTIMRQLRRVEEQRKDPLIGAVLQKLEAGRAPETKSAAPQVADQALPDEAVFEREARRVMRRLCETGAVLAVAAEMEKAVVVRDLGEGGSARTAVVDAGIAEALALKEWITCDDPGRISRYRITASGRAALNKLMASQESRLRGFAEAQAGFATSLDVEQAMEDQEREAQKNRYVVAESPLISLARRRDRDGRPFLSDKLVAAGERLREDFELSQIEADETVDLTRFLTTPSGPVPSAPLLGAKGAQRRLHVVLSDLGPGLGDVALRCCCQLEGLETTEKDLGWAARSGKVVLRIALQRVRRSYEELTRRGEDMVG